MLDALGIRRLSAPGYEADDLIATLATEASAQDMDVLIVTGDRDVLQLVSDRVTALMTRRGITEMTRFTPEAVLEKYGLSPSQYPDFAALRGDPSDNLPGIPGVGEKTATKWIAEFGSLAALVDRVDEVGKARQATRCASTWPACCATVSSPRCSPTCPPRRSAPCRVTCCPRPGTGAKRVHFRRRHLPGRAGTAFRPGARCSAARPLPLIAPGQPEPLHVPPAVPRAGRRRLLARADGAGCATDG